MEILLDYNSYNLKVGKELSQYASFQFIKLDDTPFDSDNRARFHPKFIIIDRQCLIDGSANLTLNAFKNNIEYLYADYNPDKI